VCVCVCVCIADGRCPKGWLVQQGVVCVGTSCYSTSCHVISCWLCQSSLLVCNVWLQSSLCLCVISRCGWVSYVSRVVSGWLDVYQHCWIIHLSVSLAHRHRLHWTTMSRQVPFSLSVCLSVCLSLCASVCRCLSRAQPRLHWTMMSMKVSFHFSLSLPVLAQCWLFSYKHITEILHRTNWLQLVGSIGSQGYYRHSWQNKQIDATVALFHHSCLHDNCDWLRTWESMKTNPTMFCWLV